MLPKRAASLTKIDVNRGNVRFRVLVSSVYPNVQFLDLDRLTESIVAVIDLMDNGELDGSFTLRAEDEASPVIETLLQGQGISTPVGWPDVTTTSSITMSGLLRITTW